MNKNWMTGAVALGALATITTAGIFAPSALAQGRGNGNNGRWNRPSQDRPWENDRQYNRDYRRAASGNWSRLEGKPRFDTNSTPGFYVWKEGENLYIVANARNRKNDQTRFSGSVTVRGGGTLSNLSGYEAGSDDRWNTESSNRVTFNLNVGDGLDGIKVKINGGLNNREYLELDLRAEGRGSDHIYLGRDRRVVTRTPVIITD